MIIKINVMLFIIIFSVISLFNANALSLSQAIEQSASKIAEELPAGTRIAIVAFESENEQLSGFIMDELAGALFDLKFEIANRQSIEYVIRELRLRIGNCGFYAIFAKQS